MTSSTAGKTSPDLERLQAAVAHFQRAEYGEAVQILKAIPDRSPFYFDALHLQGTIYYKSGEFERGIALLKQALGLNPENAQLLNTLASAFLELNLYEQAVKHYQHALQLAPDYLDAEKNLIRCRKRFGLHLLEKNEYTAASEQFRHVLARDKSDLDACLQLAFISQQTGDFESAKDRYEQVLNALGVNDFHSVTIDQFRNTGNENKVIVKCLYNLAVVNLTLGDYENGWRGYCARPSLLDNASPLHQQVLPDNLTSKKLLVINDQGLGDELFFLRYLPLLEKRGAHVDYKPHTRLTALLKNHSELKIVEQPDSDDYDYVIAVGDLPFTLNEVMPHADALALRTNPARSSELHEQLASMGPPPYLGISWRAGSANPDNALATSIRKSIPLNELMDSLCDFNGTLCILQRFPEDAELTFIKEASTSAVADFSALNDNLTDMLCLLSQLDDYIGVSNTNMHLRGSLNLPAAVLIPFPPEWRWQSSGEHTDWYPPFELYREQNRSWDKACAQIQQRIRSLNPHG